MKTTRVESQPIISTKVIRFFSNIRKKWPKDYLKQENLIIFVKKISMKRFLSREHFINLRVLYLLVFLLGLSEYLFFVRLGKDIPLFDPLSFLITIIMTAVACYEDPQKHFNLGTLLGLGSSYYLLSHFIHYVFLL